MRPEARRRRTRAPDQKVRTFDKRAGTGEKKGHKRMAETGAVFDVAVPDGPARTPEQVMRPEGGSGKKKPPRAQNRWYTCDITAGRDVTIGKVFDEAERRDPGHARTWIALIDGDIYQLGLIRARPPRGESPWPSWSISSTCWNTCGRRPGASTPPATPRWKTG